jgi:hypothetical protein
MRVVAAVLFVGMIGVHTTAGDRADPRVRSSSPAIVAALAEAAARSATFRSIVAKIEETDGIVYIERGRCRHGVAACLSLLVHSGGGYRMLRILVDGVDNLASLVATMAHELRHALELLSEPAVRTTAAAYNFYLREAPTSRDVFETDAAIQTGLQVEREFLRQR